MMKLWRVVGKNKVGEKVADSLIVARTAVRAAAFCRREAAELVSLKKFWAFPASVNEIREWYKDTVGYDPMAETPPLPEAEFLELASEYMQEIEE